MPWVKIDHHCQMPHWGDIHNDGAKAGDIWECDDCGTQWELVDPYDRYTGDGCPVAEWRELPKSTNLAQPTAEDIELARRARYVRAWWADWPESNRARVREMSSFLANSLEDLRDPTLPLVGMVPPTMADEPG